MLRLERWEGVRGASCLPAKPPGTPLTRLSPSERSPAHGLHQAARCRSCAGGCVRAPQRRACGDERVKPVVWFGRCTVCGACVTARWPTPCQAGIGLGVVAARWLRCEGVLEPAAFLGASPLAAACCPIVVGHISERRGVCRMLPTWQLWEQSCPQLPGILDVANVLCPPANHASLLSGTCCTRLYVCALRKWNLMS